MATRTVTVTRPGNNRRPTWARSSLAILKGLWITQSHFLRNLWGFIRRKPTVFTIQFPEQRLHRQAEAPRCASCRRAEED